MTVSDPILPTDPGADASAGEIPASAPSSESSPDEMRKVFERFDTNGDGKISSDELYGVIHALGSNPSSEEISRVMETIDTDQDGFISFEEFIAFWKSAADTEGGAGDLKAAFDMYDEDKDGLISVMELQHVLKKLGDSYSLAECSKMIAHVDSDGDGSVNYSEFQKMMAAGKLSLEENADGV